jgi:hypothetical protein
LFRRATLSVALTDEEVAGGSLPSPLGRFAMLHPGVKLEVQIGVSAS